MTEGTLHYPQDSDYHAYLRQDGKVGVGEYSTGRTSYRYY